MKSFNSWIRSGRTRRMVAVCAGLCAAMLLGVSAARAELESWAQNAEASSEIERALFKVFALPSGSVVGRRLPAESRNEFTAAIQRSPDNAELYTLRALEAERQLDFAAAEADWKKASELSKDKFRGSLELADFYQRRVQPKNELTALSAAVSGAGKRGEPVFTRMLDVVESQDLDTAAAENVFQTWAREIPESQEARKKAVQYFAARKDFRRAEAFLGDFQKAFVAETAAAMELRGLIETERGTPDAALAAFDREFRPEWPESAAQAYMGLAERAGKIRVLRDQARARLAASPDDLAALARLYHYHRFKGDSASNVALLNSFLNGKDARKSDWSEGDLLAVARMFEGSGQFDQASRCYHTLYLKGGPAASTGLTAIARLLLDVPEQRLTIGANELTMYRDIAKADPYPGYLNGVLSLLLNTSSPWSEYGAQNSRARPYFHRARGAELLDLVDQQFPNAPERSTLRAQLVNMYATYGEAEAVIREGDRFLTAFPNAPERTRVSFAMTDAYTRLGREREEFAIYERLLKELSEKAGGVPVGFVASAPEGVDRTEEGRDSRRQQVQSSDYVRVLDRYIGRLVSTKRLQPALAVYRAELDRNPNDPGIYERLAAFLDQNKLGNEIEQVYRKAMERFPEKTWSHKLARWYLRQKRTADFEALTRDVTRTFSGSDLGVYFNAVVPREGISQAMYRQLNQYARERFPHNLQFVRNLLATTPENDPAFERMLRENWMNAEDLRSRYFGLLSKTRRLDTELQTIQAANPTLETNPVALRMLAEGEAWRTRFEAAQPHFGKLASGLVLDEVMSARSAALHRSLSDVSTAVAIEDTLDRYEPSSVAARIRIGEMYADREQYPQAKAVWDRIPQLYPGRPDGYLETATIYWDYFQFDDALRTITQARANTRKPALYSYEEGAIRENRREYGAAADAYVRGALAGEETSKNRLLQLAERSNRRGDVEQAVNRVAGGNTPKPEAAQLLIRLYEVQRRRPELEAKLLSWAAASDSPDLLGIIDQSANASAFPKVTQRVAERRVELASDPVERLRLRLEVARLVEAQGDKAGATRLVDQIYAENTNIMGVIRSAVNLHWRVGSKPKALEILEASAGKAADQQLRNALLLETAQKAIQAPDLARADRIADQLLRQDPYSTQYLAAKAAVFGARKDDAGLRDFYRASLDSIAKSNLSSGERVETIAGMRRNLIPVLKRMGDMPGALDQYIELVNRYPEDESLVREAGKFASESKQEQRLLDYYAKTATTSSKDYRWPLVLANLQSQFGDAPASVSSLQKATAIRPDRVDLLTRQAELEERLLRFEEAGASYRKLYELTYRDPYWMSHAALCELRLGRSADAVKTLRAAYLEDRPETVSNYADVVSFLNTWGQTKAAREAAKQGIRMAGGDGSSAASLVEMDGMLAARLHEPLAPPASLGAASRTQSRMQWWRGAARGVKTYGTPAEKVQLATTLEQPDWSAEDRVEIADRAGLLDVLARALAVDDRNLGRLTTLQMNRGRFDELGAQLEALAKPLAITDEKRPGFLKQAQEAYRRAGNVSGELRVVGLLRSGADVDDSANARYAELIARQPQTALRLLASTKNYTLHAALLNEMIARGRPADVLGAIKASATTRQPAWGNAYVALAGLHYGDSSPATRAAFDALLGPPKIGDRLAQASVDSNRQITGDAWFYYADRYADFLRLAKDSAVADYSGAEVESHGASIRAYLAEGDFYMLTGDFAKAREEYNYAAQFSGANSTVQAKIATALGREGKNVEAIEAWKLAFAQMQKEIAGGSAYFHTLMSAINEVVALKITGQLRSEMDRTVESYLQRHGVSYLDGLFESGFRAADDPVRGANWIVRMADQAPAATDILRGAAQAKWLPAEQQSVIYDRLAAKLIENQAQVTGDQRLTADDSVAQVRVDQLRLALKSRQAARAATLLAGISADMRNGSYQSQFQALELQVAAQTGGLPDLASRFRKDPGSAPDLATILMVASELRESGSTAAANTLLEFAYERELENGSNAGSNYTGLAGVRLAAKDTAGALRLLKRMAVVADDAAGSLISAADLLESNGLQNEAREFLEMALKLRPWDGAARVRLGQGSTVAADPNVEYRIRAQGALAVARAKGAPLQTGIAELDLLSSAAPLTEAQAAQRYFLDAPIFAAVAAKGETKLKLLQAALAVQPQEPGLRGQTAIAAAAARRDVLALAISNGEYGPSSVESGGLHASEHRTLIRALSGSQERLGKLAAAIQFEEAVDELPAPAADKAASRRRLDALNRLQTLNQVNAGFIPVFGPEIQQSGKVRPKFKTLPDWVARDAGGGR